MSGKRFMAYNCVYNVLDYTKLYIVVGLWDLRTIEVLFRAKQVLIIISCKWFHAGSLGKTKCKQSEFFYATIYNNKKI